MSIKFGINIYKKDWKIYWLLEKRVILYKIVK